MIVGEFEELPGVEVGGSGRPRVGGLRDDGIVGFSGEFQSPPGIIDDNIDALVFEGVDGASTGHQLIGHDHFFFDFDDVDFPDTGGDGFEESPATISDDKHGFGIGFENLGQGGEPSNFGVGESLRALGKDFGFLKSVAANDEISGSFEDRDGG